MPNTITEHLKRTWVDKSTYAVTLLALFVDLYGGTADHQDSDEMSGIYWSPETIRMEIEHDFAVKMPDSNFSKLMTAISLLLSDSFYKSVGDFIELSNALVGNGVTYGQFEPLEIEDAAWAITEALLIMPPDDNNAAPFSPEIQGYIGYMCDENGILNPPDVLNIAVRNEDLIQRVQYNFADDDEMMSTVWQVEKSKTDEINTMIKRNLSELLHQLAELPLKNGDTKNITTSMLSNIEKRETSNSVL